MTVTRRLIHHVVLQVFFLRPTVKVVVVRRTAELQRVMAGRRRATGVDVVAVAVGAGVVVAVAFGSTVAFGVAVTTGALVVVVGAVAVGFA